MHRYIKNAFRKRFHNNKAALTTISCFYISDNDVFVAVWCNFCVSVLFILVSYVSANSGLVTLISLCWCLCRCLVRNWWFQLILMFKCYWLVLTTHGARRRYPQWLGADQLTVGPRSSYCITELLPNEAYVLLVATKNLINTMHLLLSLTQTAHKQIQKLEKLVVHKIWLTHKFFKAKQSDNDWCWSRNKVKNTQLT